MLVAFHQLRMGLDAFLLILLFKNKIARPNFILWVKSRNGAMTELYGSTQIPSKNKDKW